MKKILSKSFVRYTGEESTLIRVHKGAQKIEVKEFDLFACDSKLADEICRRYKKFVIVEASDLDAKDLQSALEKYKSVVGEKTNDSLSEAPKKKGGRPKLEVNKEPVEEKKEELKSE